MTSRVRPSGVQSRLDVSGVQYPAGFRDPVGCFGDPVGFKFTDIPNDLAELWTASDPRVLKGTHSAEFANSRLAMVLVVGMFLQDGLMGNAWGDKACARPRLWAPS